MRRQIQFAYLKLIRRFSVWRGGGSLILAFSLFGREKELVVRFQDFLQRGLQSNDIGCRTNFNF